MLKDKKNPYLEIEIPTVQTLIYMIYFYLLMIKILKIHYINLKNGFKKKFH